MVNGKIAPLTPTSANREIQVQGPELRLPGDINNPNKADVIISDGLVPMTGAVQFTLLVPDGPTDPQITAATASKDSFATGKNDSRPFVYYSIHLPKEGLSFRPT